MVNWFIDSSIQWFTESVIHWFMYSLIHWFIHPLIPSVIDSSTHRLTSSPMNGFIGSLHPRITESLIYCITVSLIHRFMAWLICWVVYSLLFQSFINSLKQWFIASSAHEIIHTFSQLFITDSSESSVGWCFDSVIHCVLESLIRRFIGSLVHWLDDSLSHCFAASLNHWTMSSLIHRFIGSLIQRVAHGFFHVMPLASRPPFSSSVDAPHNFNCSWLLHLKNVPMGHWFPIAISYFRNSSPCAGRALSGNLSSGWWWFGMVWTHPKRRLISINHPKYGWSIHLGCLVGVTPTNQPVDQHIHKSGCWVRAQADETWNLHSGGLKLVGCRRFSWTDRAHSCPMSFHINFPKRLSIQSVACFPHQSSIRICSAFSPTASHITPLFQRKHRLNQHWLQLHSRILEWSICSPVTLARAPKRGHLQIGSWPHKQRRKLASPSASTKGSLPTADA